jgi:fibronectin type 3 domain-containing protein
MTATLTASGASVSVSSDSSTDARFAASGLNFPITVAAGTSISFTVGFTPATTGAASASLSFISNATNSPTVQSLSGTGVNASHSVGLSWDETSAVVGYNVYRGIASGGPYSRINSTLDPTTSYTDNAVTGGATYYYVTTSVNSSGLESGYSNEAVAMIPSP